MGSAIHLRLGLLRKTTLVRFKGERKQGSAGRVDWGAERVEAWRSLRTAPSWLRVGESVTRVSELREQLIQIIETTGHLRLTAPVLLASGDPSRHFVDTKRALASGSNLRLAAAAFCELVDEMGWKFDALGGLTMGADPLAHAVAIVDDREWFSVRKEPKERGTNRRIEGAVLGSGRSVVLIDDVVTRGGSIGDALSAIRDTGATVVGAVSLVDRGRDGKRLFSEFDIPYRSLVTYEDLGIPAVGDEPGLTSATG